MAGRVQRAVTRLPGGRPSRAETALQQKQQPGANRPSGPWAAEAALGQGPGPRPWAKSLGPGPGPRPWALFLGQDPGPGPCAKALGPGPGPKPCARALGPGPGPWQSIQRICFKEGFWIILVMFQLLFHGSGLKLKTLYIVRRCASVWRGPGFF